MRILTVVYDLDIGGTQRAAVAFANAYARLGHDSRILVTDNRGPRADELESTVIIAGPGSDIREIGDWAPDLVHVHGHGLQEAMVRELHAVTPHATWVEQNVFAHVTPWTDLLACSFVFSRWCEHQYALSPGHHAPVARISNPIESQRFYADPAAGTHVRRELGIPENAVVMGRIGQPQTYKWAPLVVEAFDTWAGRDPRAWLLLVGAPESIRHRVEASPHRDRIVIVDRLEGDDALRSHYAAMDLFGHAALQGETFGYVLAEAALCEVPIVTLATPWADNSQSEVVGHEVGGMVTTTARGFTAAVCELAADTPLRGRLGAAGRAWALERYDAGVVASAALEAGGQASPARPMSDSELLTAYSEAIDPPRGSRLRAFQRRMWPTVAWLSGVQSLPWLAQTTLNRWGISRHGLSRPPSAGA